MKSRIIFNLFVTVMAASCLFATGCKKKPGMLTPLPNSTAGNIGDQTIGQAAPMTSDQSGVNANNAAMNSSNQGIPQAAGQHIGWAEDRDSLKADNVYFDFDKSAIKASEQPKLAAIGDYLKSNTAAAVRVEGNCDERGTEEYNRALGERRALAAREYLVNLGVDASRVDTLSKGEDNPAESGHDEAAWKKNRRDEFVVLTAPK